MRLAGSEFFRMLGEVNKFDTQRGQPGLSDPLLGSNGSDPTKGMDGGSAPPGAPGSNSSPAVAHQHHHAHPSSDKPGDNGQGQQDSSGPSPASSHHIRRGGLLDEVA
jgi:hypothetical protein